MLAPTPTSNVVTEPLQVSQLDAVTALATQLPGSRLLVDVPNPAWTANSPNTVKRFLTRYVGYADLVQQLQTVGAPTNGQRGTPKIVLYASSADPGCGPNDPTLDRLASAVLCVGTEATVLLPYRKMVLARDPTGPLTVATDGDFRGPTTARWANPAEAYALGEQPFNPLTAEYAQGARVNHRINGVLRLFSAVHLLRRVDFAGNALPLPGSSPADWEEVSPAPAVGPNQRPDLWKEVTHMTRAEAGPNGGDVFEELDFAKCCMFTTIIVEFYRATPTSPEIVGQRLVAQFDGGPNPACHIYRDGRFNPAENLLPARFVRVEDARDFIPYDSVPTGYNWPADKHTSHYVGTPLTEQYFKRRTPGGPVPAAPVEGGDPTYWEPSSFTALPPASTAYDDTAVRNLIDDVQGNVADLRSDLSGVQTLVDNLQTGKVEVWQPGPKFANCVYLLVSGIGTGLYQPKSDIGNSQGVSLGNYSRLADFRFLPTQDVEQLVTTLAGRVTVLENTPPATFDYFVSDWNAQTNALPSLYALPETPLPARGRYYCVSGNTAPFPWPRRRPPTPTRIFRSPAPPALGRATRWPAPASRPARASCRPTTTARCSSTSS